MCTSQLVGVSGISLGLEGSKVSFAIAVLPGTAVDINATGPSMQILFIHDIYARPAVDYHRCRHCRDRTLGSCKLPSGRPGGPKPNARSRGSAEAGREQRSTQCPTIKNGS